MPLIVIKKNNAKGSAGDGGNVGIEKYMELVLGPPHFAPYVLPKNILIKRVVAISSIDQTCSVIGTRPDNTTIDIVPETQFTSGKSEAYAPSTHQATTLVVDTFDASAEAYLYVTITYQDFTIII